MNLMNSERIQVLVNLGLVGGIDEAHRLHNIVWHAQLDQDEADEVFATQVGTLVWAD